MSEMGTPNFTFKDATLSIIEFIIRKIWGRHYTHRRIILLFKLYLYSPIMICFVPPMSIMATPNFVI